MSQDLYTVLRQTADATLAAYSSPNPWNPDQVWATRTDDCQHCLHPREAMPEGLRPPVGKDQHISTLKLFGPIFETLELETRDAVVDVQNKTVVVRLTAKYDLAAVGDDYSPDRGLTTEFMWLMEMDESGTKIKRIEDFVDYSTFLAGVIARAEKYAQSQKSTK